MFLINSQGKTLMHPLLPSPHAVTEDPATVTINMLEQCQSMNSLLREVIRQENGVEVSITMFSLILGEYKFTGMEVCYLEGPCL